MIIKRDEAFEKFWLAELRAIPQRKRESSEDIHVSDLIFCLRKAYFDLKGLESEDEDKSVLFKVVGKAHHSALQVLRGHLSEMRVKKYGVSGTIDLFKDVPIEIKSTRKNVESVSDISPLYLRQLAYYGVMMGSLAGKLAILNIIQANFRVFDVAYSEDEFDRNSEEFFGRRDLLLKAVRENNVSIIPPPPPEEKWQCKDCRKGKFCQAEQRDHDNGV